MCQVFSSGNNKKTSASNKTSRGWAGEIEFLLVCFEIQVHQLGYEFLLATDMPIGIAFRIQFRDKEIDGSREIGISA
ncbi:MAG: hypothetical protein COV72_09430 [Candidatus Omnitrophica bacterium CG11_big_fil_rev_8_21_14_0_20_42_13]|uniref:Uncharacterized protein n=1 Tax=Candidatus Ghiorseimicrobium undicola TaxID=1974746 RepID=A0A2H0LV34_9BACT|nr:MAG: hypothetical protein COV72_09430 [Candidatus Omnitrophica bacterium CG11_big_fil_rev_8_21_14_0_20_42_13]